jgi:hypothetical protein
LPAISASGFPGNLEDPYREGIMAMNFFVMTNFVYPTKITIVFISQINAKFVVPNILSISWIYRRLNNDSASSGMLPD